MDYYDRKYDYVLNVTFEAVPAFDFDTNGEMEPSDYNYRKAVERINTLNFPFRYEDYIGDMEIIATLNGYNIDIEKFWFAILCIYDITMQKCINAGTLRDSYREQAQKLSDYLNGVRNITLSAKGKPKLEVTGSILIADIKMYIDEILQREDNPEYEMIPTDLFTDDLKSPSVQMWYAATRFLELFKTLNLPNKRAKDEKIIYEWDNLLKMKVPVKGGAKTVSFNKTLLVSRLLYLMRLTKNDAFLFSDNSLKGILEQYKGFALKTISRVYSA